MTLRFLLKRFLFLAFFLTSWSSHAEVKLFAEPYLGWARGDFSTKDADLGGLGDSAFCGFDFGARLLMSYDEFFLGPDVSSTLFGNMKFAEGDSVERARNSKIGLVAGVDFEKTLRFWLGYHFLDRINSSVSTLDHKADFVLSGTSFKLGVGYYLHDFLSLNVEYLRTSYGKFQGTTAKGLAFSYPQTLSGADVITGSMFSFSVSAPIEFYSFWY